MSLWQEFKTFVLKGNMVDISLKTVFICIVCQFPSMKKMWPLLLNFKNSSTLSAHINL